MDRLLKTRDITVCFGDHVVLDHISADFHAGVMTAVIGSNGVGKTTYLKAIARQLHCGGEVQLYEKGVTVQTGGISPMCRSLVLCRRG